MVDLWATRREAEKALLGPLDQEAAAVVIGFRVVDLCSTLLGGIESPFALVCGGTLAKGRNLALACYSLALDGLAQEGGAVLRPLIGTIEMLLYFSQDISRAERVSQGKKLPREGEIAQTIDSSFKALRDYLNNHASHAGFTYESMQHLLDVEAGAWRVTQHHSDAVLRENLKMVWAALFMLATGALRCLDVSKSDNGELVDVMDEWWRVTGQVFGFNLETMAESEVQDGNHVGESPQV